MDLTAPEQVITDQAEFRAGQGSSSAPLFSLDLCPLEHIMRGTRGTGSSGGVDQRTDKGGLA